MMGNWMFFGVYVVWLFIMLKFIVDCFIGERMRFYGMLKIGVLYWILLRYESYGMERGVY